MLPWSVRLLATLALALAALLGLEVAAATVQSRAGVAGLWFLPLSLGVLVLVGWYVVRHMPLTWGVLAGATLYGLVSLLAFPLRYWLAYGAFAWPRDSDLLIVAAAIVVQLLEGALAGFAGGWLARRRRRRRQRAEAAAVLASSRATVLEPGTTSTLDAGRLRG